MRLKLIIAAIVAIAAIGVVLYKPPRCPLDSPTIGDVMKLYGC